MTKLFDKRIQVTYEVSIRFIFLLFHFLLNKNGIQNCFSILQIFFIFFLLSKNSTDSFISRLFPQKHRIIYSNHEIVKNKNIYGLTKIIFLQRKKLENDNENQKKRTKKIRKKKTFRHLFRRICQSS